MTIDNVTQFIERYSRQLVLPDFGEDAQTKLAKAKVLIVGCGGLGAPVIEYLASAGVGNLTLMDGDRIELSNLNRQVLFKTIDIGFYKAERAANFARELNPSVSVNFKTERLGSHNARHEIQQYDLILDCTDGLLNKFLLNDACVLEKKPLIHGAVLKLEGRLLVINQTSCLRCLFPDNIISAGMASCQMAGVLGPVCGLIGSLMAIEAIKILSEAYHVQESRYFIMDCTSTLNFHSMDIQRNPECMICNADSKAYILRDELYMTEECSIS
jgi:molybdopterin/thiamine biosynthesis adenylyltransferase